jgi:hypothetical protein
MYHFVQNVYTGIEKKIKISPIFELNESISGFCSLLEYQAELKLLFCSEEKTFRSYSTLNTKQKTLVKDASKALTIYCARSIRKRFLELGFDNYYNALKNYTVSSFLAKLENLGYTNMYDKVVSLQLSHNEAAKKSKRPREFSLNDDVLSTVFRVDNYINQQVECMLLTCYAFIHKQALKYSSCVPENRKIVDQDDFFNSSVLGYLAAAIVWNCEFTHTKAYQSSFSSFGWEFSKRYCRVVFHSTRLIRFPAAVEDLIKKTHLQIQEKRESLIKANPSLSSGAIETKVKLELAKELAKVYTIFEYLGGECDTRLTSLPYEQSFLRLDKFFNDDNSQLSFHELLATESGTYEDLYLEQIKELVNVALSNLDPKSSVLLNIKYGIEITKEEWNLSGLSLGTMPQIGDEEIFPLSYVQIGHMVNRSRESVRKSIVRSLIKIQDPNLNKELISLSHYL